MFCCTQIMLDLWSVSRKNFNVLYRRLSDIIKTKVSFLTLDNFFTTFSHYVKSEESSPRTSMVLSRQVSDFLGKLWINCYIVLRDSQFRIFLQLIFFTFSERLRFAFFETSTGFGSVSVLSFKKGLAENFYKFLFEI